VAIPSITPKDLLLQPHAGTNGLPSVEILDETAGGARAYELRSDQPLRDDFPPGGRLRIAEPQEGPRCRSGSVRFDALYAMAVQEARQNAVSRVNDADYAHGKDFEADVYQTGEQWHFVWTRDLAYALHLGLALYDPERAMRSLRFKASEVKACVEGGFPYQIVQDTGSGGSYPVSTDRIVWALGAHQTMCCLDPARRTAWRAEIFPFLRDTIEQDRRLIFDETDGLYRGEQSFLDWREQTYPQWTADNVLAIAMSKALSTNVAYVFMLETASACARELGHPAEHERYAGWARELREAVNRVFYDAGEGLYRAYQLTESGECALPVKRYDLLGQCLVILFDIADEERARHMLARYPVGRHGPPVVWPQEAGVPIYHNQGIWPFVTAYWLKAARKVNHVAAIDAGVRSLVELAASNLSNMENFDFVSGLAHVTAGERVGPVINSRRQLWSVAGYLSLVHEVVFGFRATQEGLRLEPYVTAWMRRSLFARSAHMEIKGLPYQGTVNDILVHLPPAAEFNSAVARCVRVLLNGTDVTGRTLSASELSPGNAWEVFLEASADDIADESLRTVNGRDGIYCPTAPEWDDAAGAIQPEDDRLRLSFSQPSDPRVVVDIFRDGQVCAQGITQGEWVDPDSGAYGEKVCTYHLVSRHLDTGFTSHPTPGRSTRGAGQSVRIPAGQMSCAGAQRDERGPLERWGRPEEVIDLREVRVPRSGRYAVRVEFSNGSGPINTGITCAVKRLDVLAQASGEVIRSAYVVMPQSGSWDKYALSNSLLVDLDEKAYYHLRLLEDPLSRNMSYLASNEKYTARAGGGDSCYNFVNLAGVHLSLINASQDQ
jgi:hypothetical protein